MDYVVCNQVNTKKRNLFTAYVDYKKAFDSGPHEWILAIINLYWAQYSKIPSWMKIELETLDGTNMVNDIIPI